VTAVTTAAPGDTTAVTTPALAEAVPPPKVVPPLGPVPRVKQPTAAERVLRSGLRVVAVRRPGVPLIEVRLRVPFGGTAPSHPARSSLLANTMLAGTADRSQVELAAELQALGADLSVSADSDRLVVGGAVLRTGLATLLGLVGEVLEAASYPSREVAGERSRLAERLAILRSQPSVLVGEALNHRLYGSHPYARELATPDAVQAVTAAQLRKLHSDRVRPDGSVLVLVGDLSPARALDTAEKALGSWGGTSTGRPLPPLPPVEPLPLLLVDRPGSVQASIRIGGPAVRREEPDYPALQLANLAFGGYFSSRLVENIREDKGYTYGPHSRISHSGAGSRLVVDADVATGVTAPALLEIWYELGRMATLPITPEELENVRQYAVGSLALSIATQAGLASTLSALIGVGLGLDWLREHPRRLAAVTLEETFAAGRAYLAPAGMLAVVLGEAEKIGGPLAALGPVERA
jgi:predicted Zn-dependent peptidase